MSHPDIDEQVPVRGFTDYSELAEDKAFSKDEEQEGALRRVQALLRSEAKKLHEFNAFDITESDLKIKQQIKVHKMVADIIEPVLEMVEQALSTVDENFRQRNNK